MNRFFLFGKYSAGGIREISAERTAQVCGLVKKMGGEVHDIYALLGEYDLVLIVELPSMTDAMKAGIGLAQLTGISFSTSAAMRIEEFDRMAADLVTEIESARMEAGE